MEVEKIDNPTLWALEANKFFYDSMMLTAIGDDTLGFKVVDGVLTDMPLNFSFAEGRQLLTGHKGELYVLYAVRHGMVVITIGEERFKIALTYKVTKNA